MTVDVAMKFYSMYNAHDVDLLDGLLAQDYVGTINGQAVSGISAAKSVIGGFLAAFPDVAYQIDDTVAHDERVVARWTATATHDGSFAGIEPTRRRVTMIGMTMFRVVDGRISELWNIWDVAGLLRQLQAIRE